jgi:hypothetical protein
LRSLNHAVRCAVSRCAVSSNAISRSALRHPVWVAALTALIVAFVLVLPTGLYSATPATAAPAAAQAPAGGGCTFQQINGGWQWVCTDITGTPGRPGTGGGGGGAKSACTLTPLSQQQATFLGLQWPPPANHTWDAITCPGNQAFGGVTLVDNATGAPAVTPAQLAVIAVGDLIIPDLEPNTAPPRDHDGLVGLPEWFWIPGGDWGAVQSPRVTAGPVWAQATAEPTKIIFSPGPGLPGVTCNGPGTAYQPKVPLSEQSTDCSYTYAEPSVGQPGNVYAASVTVLWHVFWVGSGGTGGQVAAGEPVTTPFTVPVAAGEALVTK